MSASQVAERGDLWSPLWSHHAEDGCLTSCARSRATYVSATTGFAPSAHAPASPSRSANHQCRRAAVSASCKSLITRLRSSLPMWREIKASSSDVSSTNAPSVWLARGKCSG
jgi:uncharacterized lipoprotein YbaY